MDNGTIIKLNLHGISREFKSEFINFIAKIVSTDIFSILFDLLDGGSFIKIWQGSPGLLTDFVWNQSLCSSSVLTSIKNGEFIHDTKFIVHLPEYNDGTIGPIEHSIELKQQEMISLLFSLSFSTLNIGKENSAPVNESNDMSFSRVITFSCDGNGNRY